LICRFRLECSAAQVGLQNERTIDKWLDTAFPNLREKIRKEELKTYKMLKQLEEIKDKLPLVVHRPMSARGTEILEPTLGQKGKRTRQWDHEDLLDYMSGLGRYYNFADALSESRPEDNVEPDWAQTGELPADVVEYETRLQHRESFDGFQDRLVGYREGSRRLL
jgi:hypothetical protein